MSEQTPLSALSMTALIKEVTHKTQLSEQTPLSALSMTALIKEVTHKTQHVRTDPLISSPHGSLYQRGNVTNTTYQNRPPYQPYT